MVFVNKKKALPSWLQIIGYEVKDNLETIDDLLNYSEMTVLLNEKQKKLIDSLEDLDDVIEVFHNWEE